ncbi:MAG: hypothetical protein ACIAS6_13200 [Phycisphaerales bacterium JB060]
MPPQPPDKPVYTETQYLHQNAIVRYLVPISAITSSGLAVVVMGAKGAPATSIAVAVAVGLGLPLLLGMLPQRTVVTERELRVRSIVGWGRRVPIDAIGGAQAVRYNPLADCGGWGLRMSKKHGLVLNVSGDRGVHVRYAWKGAEKSMLIGSRRSEELARAIALAADLPADAPGHGDAPFVPA